MKARRDAVCEQSSTSFDRLDPRGSPSFSNISDDRGCGDSNQQQSPVCFGSIPLSSSAGSGSSSSPRPLLGALKDIERPLVSLQPLAQGAQSAPQGKSALQLSVMLERKREKQRAAQQEVTGQVTAFEDEETALSAQFSGLSVSRPHPASIHVIWYPGDPEISSAIATPPEVTRESLGPSTMDRRYGGQPHPQ